MVDNFKEINVACNNGVCGVGPVANNQNNLPQPPTGNFFTGTPGGFVNVPNFTSAQQNLLDQLLPHLQGGLKSRFDSLGNAGKGFDFAPIAQEQTEDFYTNVIPTIAERFTSMGGGAQRSSAFQGALGAAGRGLKTNLASLAAQYGLRQDENNLRRQGLNDAFLGNMLSAGLAPQNQTTYFPSQPGALQSAASAIGPALLAMLKFLI